MSAVPSLKRLGDEELELLGSRYLDGDLSPEERAEFEAYLARDPEASAKLDALQAIVEEYRSLPGPDTPFALSTRIAARVQEQAIGFSGVLLRLGIVRRMGAVLVMMAGLGAVAIYYLANLGESPVQVAAKRKGTGEFVPEKDIEGPVQVFFEEKAQGPESSKEAAAVPARPAESQPVQVASAESQTADASVKANEVGRDLDETKSRAPGAISEPVAVVAQASSEQETEGKRERAVGPAAESGFAGAAAPAAPAPPAPAAPAAVSAGAGMGAEEKPAAMSATAMRRADEKLAAMPAPTAPAMAEGRVLADRAAVAKGKKQAAGPAVSVTGPAGKAAEWRMVGTAEPPTLTGGAKALFHVVLDPSGKVKKVIRISGPSSGIDEWLKGAKFEKVAGEPASNEIEVKVEARPE